MRYHLSRFRLLTLVIMTASHVPAVSAALPDILEKDIHGIEQSLENTAADETMQRQEATWEETDELFPIIPVETKGTLEEKKDARIAEFLTMTIDGKEVVFKDVPAKEWFTPYIRVMAEAGIVSGYKDANGVPLGLFKPANPVSVEELAKILVVQTHIDTTTCPATSKNVTASGSWATGFMACAEAKQWTIYSDATIDAKRPATRAEVIATMLEAYKKEPVEPKGTVFKDVQASMQFAGSIERAHADGVVIGYTDDEGNALGMFGPSDDVKRAELAKMLTVAREIYSK